MITPKNDLVGDKYGRLTVVLQAEDIVYNNIHYTAWYCNCDCGTKNVIARGKDLRSGSKQSCGCITKERLKKYNEYDLSGEYGIGITFNTNRKFYFDLEDYDKIKNYCWFEDTYGYIVAKSGKNEHIRLSRLVMGVLNLDGRKTYVDHIGGSNTKHDNRKLNLRVATPKQNAMNSKIGKNNTSGNTGVFYIKRKNKWEAGIKIDNDFKVLGYFDRYEDAVSCRKTAEEKYYGMWSYDNSQSYYNNINKDGDAISENLD